MGVTASKKSFSSTLFGYTTSIKTSVYIKHELKEKEDNILFRPFLYGLGIHQSNSNYSFKDVNASGSRTDSGFLLYEKNSQLWKDLTYIDQTYYNNKEDIIMLPSQQQEIIYAPGDALNFNDVSSMCLSLHDINLSKRGFGSITSNIGLLTMIRKLDLSFNYLKDIPQEIGCLVQLEHFSISNNQIQCIPDSICHLSRLIEFNVSHNQLQVLTPFISHLHKLQTLNVAYNELKEITIVSIHHSSLTLLDLSFNPIHVLPAEITQLPFLRRLRLEGCPLTNTLDHFPLTHNPPSLLEICSRIITKTRKEPHVLLLPTELTNYLSNYNTCSHCQGPYFDSFVSRGRWIERNDIWIPLEYRLCSAHWSNESDRIYTMFSSSLVTNCLEIEPVKKWKHQVKNSLFLKKKLV